MAGSPQLHQGGQVGADHQGAVEIQKGIPAGEALVEQFQLAEKALQAASLQIPYLQPLVLGARPVEACRFGLVGVHDEAMGFAEVAAHHRRQSTYPEIWVALAGLDRHHLEGGVLRRQDS